MFKQVVTLFKGAANDASEEFVGRNALPLLRQQIREAAEALQAARKAVAIAMTQNEQEVKQYERVISRITDLETRTIAALEQGKHELAREAAETISFLEMERDASHSALESFADEIKRLKNIIRKSELKLKELTRGQRLAVATDKTQRLRDAVPGSGLSALNEAGETLENLRKRQAEIERTAELMNELAVSGDPAGISKKLAKAGCGAPLKSGVDDVLERLRKKSEKPE